MVFISGKVPTIYAKFIKDHSLKDNQKTARGNALGME
jgi:hypothetical protein